MNIDATTFDTNYHGSIKHGNNNMQDYVRHEVDVFNSLDIDGVKFEACYQTANGYYHNDYSLPRAELALSYEAGTYDFLLLVDQLTEHEIENINLEDFEVHIPGITRDQLLQIYNALIENLNDARMELDSMELSDDVNDYIEHELEPYLELKQ